MTSAHLQILGEGRVVLGIVSTEADFHAWVSGYTRWGDWGGWDWIGLYRGAEQIAVREPQLEE